MASLFQVNIFYINKLFNQGIQIKEHSTILLFDVHNQLYQPSVRKGFLLKG